jgi:energy-coupling factor transporter ATP-binding protein EcfA2
MKSIVELEKVSFYYPERETPSLKEINLTLNSGEFVLLIGPSGCGKTTLLETIAGVIPHSTGGRIRGKVIVDGEDVLRSGNKKRGIVGLVLQDPESQLTNLYVEDEIAFGPENLSRPKEQIIESLEEVLKYARLTKFRRSFVYALSGGQKQRVAIAAGLIMKPKILLMDGPTTNLDPIGANEVLQIINQLNETGVTEVVLISSNKIDALLPLATRIVVMDSSSSIVLDGKPEEVILKHLDLLKEIGVFVPELGWLIGELAKKGYSSLKLTSTVDDAYEEIKPLDLKLQGISQLDKTEEALETTREVVIQASDLTFGYSEIEVLHRTSLTIYKGEALAIVGQNGSGKTTLMKLLAGLRLPKTGKIEFMGKDTHETPALGQIGYVFQYPEHQFVTNTVIGELLFGLNGLNTPPQKAQQTVDELLAMFNLESKKDQSPYLLSMGEKRRLSVATMLAIEPEVLILDEPTTGLDRSDTDNLMAVLHKFVKEKGITVIQVSHDMEQIAEFASRVILLNEGNIIFDGTPEGLFADQELLERCKLMAPPVAILARRLWSNQTHVPITVRELLKETSYADA